MDANGLVVMPGMGPAWKMAPGRSSTLKLRNDETEESVMMLGSPDDLFKTAR
jgi:hypothetical protein